MLARVLGTEPRGGGYRGAPGKEPSSQESCFPDFPHLVQVEIRHSKSQMKIQELYSPPGAYGVTKPQTQLHWLLSPSWSSFPKGNNTCPKSPPAMASSLNLQLPGADSKSQKRTDFSRERRGKWMQSSSVHRMKTLVEEGKWGKPKRGQGRVGQDPVATGFSKARKRPEECSLSWTQSTVNERTSGLCSWPHYMLSWFPGQETAIN